MPTIALISWPIITLILFAVFGPARGLIWAVLVGYLFLPENFGFDIPGLPPYDKRTAISFSLLLPAVLYWSKVPKLPSADTRLRTIVLLLLVVLLAGTWGTYTSNTEALVNGPVVRTGLSPRDVISMVSDTVLAVIPFFLAWHFLRRPEDHRDLLVAMVVLGLVYTLLVLFELRMSPQLNKWIYGYFPHNWRQHLRGGGYRPIVFLQHGLWVGFFLMSVVLSAMALSRDKTLPRPLMFGLGIWCFLVLMLSRNLGATLLAFVFIPVVVFLGFRTQTRIAAVLAVILMSYPILSQASLTPATKLLDIVSTVSPNRAQSFQFRLENEQVLIERAQQKPAFGWGGWSRHRVLDERGRDLTVTDGLWIITLGQRGWIGYLSFFGLLSVPILFLRRAARRKPISPVIAGMAMIMGANFIYLIPNSTLSPIAFVMLGALAAFVQYDTARADLPEPSEDTGDGRQVRYTRFGTGRGDSGTPAPVRTTRDTIGQAGRT